MLPLNEYQKKARQTAMYPNEYVVIYPALGLAGEAGEVANKVKKVLRDMGGIYLPESRSEIATELGDCLWYTALLAHDLGYGLEDIAYMNLKKLESRASRGKIKGSGDAR